MENNEIVLLLKEYNLDAVNIVKLTAGSGGEKYLFEALNKEYVLKMTVPDMMNHPDMEAIISEKLLRNNINTITYIKNNSGKYVKKYRNYICNVYEYIEGSIIDLHSMEENKVIECAVILAKMHLALADLKLETGIGSNFFKYMTTDNARASYLKSREKALLENNQDIINYLDIRIGLLDKIKNYSFDLDLFTYKNSHGDYTNNQIILSNGKPFVIDLTSACYQIVVWELVRFFFHSDKTSYLYFNKERFSKYLSTYLRHIKLTDYEIKNCIRLYFYQILVCDYYHQYFAENDKNRKEDYLRQANFSSEIIKNNSYLLDTDFQL